MGMYINPGAEAYEEAVRSEVFVDKTRMTSYLNSVARAKQKYVAVSRPRRFGKTIAADMLCSYYSRGTNARALFENTLLATPSPKESKAPWDVYLGSFDVVRLTMTEFMEGAADVSQVLDYLTEEVTGELMDAHPDVPHGDRISLRKVMARILR